MQSRIGRAAELVGGKKAMKYDALWIAGMIALALLVLAILL